MKLKNILALALAFAIVGSSGITPVSAAEGDDFTVTAGTSSVNLDAGGEISVTAMPNYTASSTGSNGEAITATRTVAWTSGNTSYVTAARTDTSASGASTAQLTAGTLDGVAAGTTVNTAVTASFTYTLHHAAITKATGYDRTAITKSEYKTAYDDENGSDWEYVPAVNDDLFVGSDGEYAYTYQDASGSRTYYKYPLVSGTESDHDVYLWSDSEDDYRYFKLTAQMTTYAAYDETKTGSAAIAVHVTQTASTTGSTTQTKTVTAQHNPDGTVRKTADGDTIYDLALTFSGATRTFVQKQKVDVLFVVDVSGSMAWNFGTNSGSSNERLNAAKAAIIALQQTATGKQLDARYALVKFSSTASTITNSTNSSYWFSGFINDASSAYNNLGKLLGSADGGTNYEDGLTKANTVLASGTRPGSKTLVIFLSDGEPTFRNSEDGYTGLGGGYQVSNLTQAEAQITQPDGIKSKADYFFAVGCGSLGGAVKIYDDYGDYTHRTTTGQAILEGLTGAFTGSADTAPQYVKMATSPDALRAIFTDIINGTTSIPCRNVTITDELSGNIQFYNPAGAGITSLITVSRVNNDTNAATDITANCTVNYNPATHKVTVTLPNDNSDGTGIDSASTYKVTYPVTASDSAKEYYAEHGTYPDTADTQTGDYSGQQGFYTNVRDTGTGASPNGTFVTYTSGSATTNTAYRMPVIQIDTGTITVNKTFTGLADGVVKPAVTFTATANTLKKADGTAFAKQASVIGSSGSYTATFANLPFDTYTITENDGTGNVENYTCTVTNGSSNVTLNSANSSVNVTNTYTHDNEPDTPYITVTKTFSGIAADSIPSDFSITVKDGAAEIATLDGSSVNLTKSADGHTWTWKVGLDPALFKDLASKTFTVTENNAEITDYTLAVSINGTAVTPAADGSITGTATVRPSQISFNITKKVPNCNEQTFNIGKDVTFIAAQLTESYGYFVWTKEELTANERIAAVAYMRTQNAGFTQATLSNTYFFHGDSLTGNQYLVFRNAQVRYDLSSGELKFSATNQWAKFFYGTYSNKNGDNPEMAFANSYTHDTGSITVNKSYSGLASGITEPEVDVTVKDAAGTTVASGTTSGHTITFTGLETAEVYTIEETAPSDIANYNHTGTTYQVGAAQATTTAAQVTLTTAGATVTITNTYKLQTLTLTLKKVDGDTNMPLAGAKFQLSRWDGTAWTAYVTASNATGEYAVIPDEGVPLSDLPNGNYKLAESYVPAGYTKAADIYFQTSGGTSVALTDANRNGIAGQQGVTLDGTAFTLTAANYRNGFALPETGGAGTTVFRVIGIAILVCAVAGLAFYLVKSRKKKTGTSEK